MRKIGRNTGSVDNIIKSELINKRAGFEEERKGLQAEEI